MQNPTSKHLYSAFKPSICDCKQLFKEMYFQYSFDKEQKVKSLTSFIILSTQHIFYNIQDITSFYDSHILAFYSNCFLKVLRGKKLQGESLLWIITFLRFPKYFCWPQQEANWDNISQFQLIRSFVNQAIDKKTNVSKNLWLKIM